MIKKIKLNKSGVSEMMAYAMLIVIALTVSVGVYSFLKSYIWKPTEKCNDGVSLVIDQYWCDYAKKDINITFKNMGNFNIDGFWIRASNKTGGQAVVVLELPGKTVDGKIYITPGLAPGEIVNFAFPYSKFNRIEEVGIQPLQIKKNLAACEDAVITQTIRNCGDAPPTPPIPPVPVIPSSLVSWWKFEGNGNDEKGGNNLSLQGGGFEPGEVGKAYRVDTMGKYAKNSTPISSLQLTGDFTLEALVNLNVIPTTFNTAYIIREKNSTTTNYGLMIEKNTGKIIVNYTGVSVVTSSDVLQTGTWYHIAAVKSGTNFKVYINGDEKGINTLTALVPVYNFDELRMGWIENGLTDEVAIYNSPLSQTEISKHSQNALAGKNYFSS